MCYFQDRITYLSYITAYDHESSVVTVKIKHIMHDFVLSVSAF